jgi:hypothetical protein
LSREDHRRHDAELLAQRAMEETNKTESGRRERKEKRDLAMAIVLAAIGIVVALVLRVVWGGLSLFIGLIAFAGYIGNLERMSHVKQNKVRAIQFAIIVLGTGLEFVCLYPLRREEKASAIRGHIEAPTGLLPTEVPKFEIGDSGSILGYSGPTGKPIIAAWESELVLKNNNGELLVSARVKDRNGNMIVEIKDNEWRVSQNNAVAWEWNYDDTALEVKDGTDRVVFQIKSAWHRYQIQGEWRNDRGEVGVVRKDPETGHGLLWNVDAGSALYRKSPIVPMFRYPAKDYWARYAQNQP